MSWSRRWIGCADGSSAAPGAWSVPFAALRHPRLFALAGPAVLGSLQGGPGHPQRRPIPARSLCRLESYSTHARSARFALQSFHRAAGVHGRMTGHGRGRLAGVSAAWMPRTPLQAGPPRDLSILRNVPAARGLSPLAGNPSPLEQHQTDRQGAHAGHQAIYRLVALGIALGCRQQLVQRQEYHHASDQSEHPAEGGVRQ